MQVCDCVSFLCHPSVPSELCMPLKDGKTAAISVTGSERTLEITHMHTHMHIQHVTQTFTQYQEGMHTLRDTLETITTVPFSALKQLVILYASV